MRYGNRERLVGEIAAVAVLAVGCLTASPAAVAGRVQVGMTPAEVEAALGTPGRADGWREAVNHAPRDLSDLWSPTTIERDRAIVKADHWLYRDYEVRSSVVAVSFRGVEGDERVTAVEVYRVLRLGWHLVPWLAGAVVFGFVAAEVSRRRRTPPRIAIVPAEAVSGCL
jgi:hypothetical protein